MGGRRGLWVGWLVAGMAGALIGCSDQVPASNPDATLDLSIELPDVAPFEAADTVADEAGTRPDLEPDAVEVAPEATADVEEVALDLPVEEAAPVPCVEGKACDDGDPCTHSDVCTDGVCAGVAYKCNDKIGCTEDICDGYGGCTYPVRQDKCLIEGVCYDDGEKDPANGCLGCVAPKSNTEWSPADGTPCDDGNFCTVGDACAGGACIGLLPNPCDDKNFCTDDSCDAVKGCVHVPNTRSCSDGDACTIGDVCAKGKCVPGTTIVSCDDHNPCTDDSCDPAKGCVNAPNDHLCDDGSVCTQNQCPAGRSCATAELDHCENGACVGGTALNCADTNACTDDFCHPKLGCQHVDNQAKCNDGNPCSDGDVCAYGQCTAGPGLPHCNDDNRCTADSCDPKVGGCVHAPAAGPCDDGDPCTVGDFCEAGKCHTGGLHVNCDDNNPCTIDQCDATGACVHLPADLPCDDGDPCTVGDQCRDSACQPGQLPLACADTNPCTDDSCVPGFGCLHAANANDCSDGNACTVGDFCLSGSCVAGILPVDCDDGNPCTDDECDPVAGCVHLPADGLECDDNNNCTTGDVCTAGVCQGKAGQCDDGNSCTTDLCLAGGGCAHELIDTPDCRPVITITYPPRGAMLLGPPDSVPVTGNVSSTGGAITQFLVNDVKVNLDASGNFQTSVVPRSGTNILRFAATNQAGGQAKGVRAFMFTHQYYPADPATRAAAAIPDGAEIYLGKTVFQDDTPNVPDDFRAIILAYIKGIDIGKLIPNPLASTKVAWCNATIYGKNIKYSGPDLQLYPINGGLHATVAITNFSMDIEADLSGFACPSASGHVSANSITINVDLMVSVPTPGKVNVTLANTSANVDGLNISLDGVLGFLLNWLIDLFSNTIATQLENMVVSQLSSFAPVIAQALQSLALHQAFTIPPLLGSGKSVTITLDAVVSRADFDTLGGTVGLQATALSTKGNSYTPKGSIARSGCLDPYAEAFHFIEMHEIELGVFDDLLNQLLYAMWYGGALEFTLTQANLPPGTDLSKYGVSNLVVDVSFMLPPMLTDCTADAKFNLQVGDIKVHASLTLLGQPVTMDAYASASAPASITATVTPTGSQLSLSVDKKGLVAEIEIENASGGANAKYAMQSLLETQLLPMIFTALGNGGPIASFPIPEMDLGGLIPGLPAGTKFTIVAEQMYRKTGYTVMSGEMK